MDTQKLNKVIEKGIAFLAREQQNDGSFLCLVSERKDEYAQRVSVPAIVPSNIVLSSLAHINETPRVKSIKDLTAHFLLSQRSEFWSFNYWFKNTPEYVELPYPDDLDDTFCALAALYEYDQTLFDGEAMAKIATMLTSAEVKEGGPYDMWLVPPEGRVVWKDVDLVVNSNIGFFLSLQDIVLPGLQAFVDESIDKKKYSFPYCSDYPGLYFVSRFYKGDKKSAMIDHILTSKDSDGKWNNPLHTALAVSALLNLSHGALYKEVEKAIQYLVKTEVGGGWKPYSFFYQMKTKEKTLYAGSAATTTALCIEAISKYISAKEACTHPSLVQKKTLAQHLYSQIIARVHNRFLDFPKYFQTNAGKVLEGLLAEDTGKTIALLPALCADALRDPKRVCESDMLSDLGAANVFGWLAYTIYDGFLDREGTPHYLPIANICLRESERLFSRHANFVGKYLDIIESANAWEVANCRFRVGEKPLVPRYGDCRIVAEKSIGHALGPLIVLERAGYSDTSKEFKSLENFFRHYLVARQLDDDAHDWEEDYLSGRMTPVVASIVSHAPETFSLEQYRSIFWNTVIVSVCDKIQNCITEAKKAERDIEHIIAPEFFNKLLVPIQNSIERATHERIETLAFIQTYNNFIA